MRAITAAASARSNKLRAERFAGDEPARGEDQDRREGGDGSGDGPRECGHPSRRNTGHASSVRVVGRSSDRDAVARAAKEERQSDRREPASGRASRSTPASPASAPTSKDGNPDGCGYVLPAPACSLMTKENSEQELRDAERRHDRHEVRDVAQTPDDGDLGPRADAGRQNERAGKRDPVRDVPLRRRPRRGRRRPSAPISPCAKLISRLERKTSTRPTASSP